MKTKFPFCPIWIASRGTTTTFGLGAQRQLQIAQLSGPQRLVGIVEDRVRDDRSGGRVDGIVEERELALDAGLRALRRRDDARAVRHRLAQRRQQGLRAPRK